jgi:hypothetical protein
MLEHRIEEDLAKSGLIPSDIRASEFGNPERAACNIPPQIQGYQIPYYDIDGKPIPFYRVRAFDFEPKYKQVKNTGNYLYFPKGVRALIEKEGYVIITEGEKKAAKAFKEGFPCVALSGVDSWKNRTMTLPEGTKFSRVPGKDQISVKMTNELQDAVEFEAELAHGLQPLIDLIVSRNLFVIFCYDSDVNGVSFPVQRALANLAFEVRYKGVGFHKIKQLILPKQEEKVGIDDYLAQRGRNAFQELVTATLAKKKGFPQHPNVQEYIAKRLGVAGKLQRKEVQQVAICVLADLDMRGSRLRNKNTGDMFFFDDATRTLMDASLRRNQQDVLIDTPFSRYLWRTYGIGPADIRVLTWLATLFTSEDPIGEAEPSKVIAVKGDTICYQLNDGQYLAVSGNAAKPFEVRNNGSDGVLFESGLVEPIVAADLLRECERQLKEPYKPLWPQVLSQVRLKEKPHQVELLSMLFYLSPWLNRWRGTQLPIEMAIGEPGSGKSSLYELRLLTLIGTAALRNAPNDLKDWYASICSTGGLHVVDNLQMSDKVLRQRLSDEMCRLVTESVPRIEMRKYFTNKDLVKLPIYVTFGITAVSQPFHNADLMQRSVIIEFDKGEEVVEYESRWSNVQLDRFGGRVRWLAHHITVLHRFLRSVSKLWDERYRAKYRLMHVEQALIVMARTLGFDDTWIPDYLASATMQATTDADWAFEGICEFAREFASSERNLGKRFDASDISDWAQAEDEYKQCIQLTNTRSLGRYLKSHKQMLAIACGWKEMGKYGNRDTYTIEKLPSFRTNGAAKEGQKIEP